MAALNNASVPHAARKISGTKQHPKFTGVQSFSGCAASGSFLACA